MWLAVVTWLGHRLNHTATAFPSQSLPNSPANEPPTHFVAVSRPVEETTRIRSLGSVLQSMLAQIDGTNWSRVSCIRDATEHLTSLVHLDAANAFPACTKRQHKSWMFDEIWSLINNLTLVRREYLNLGHTISRNKCCLYPAFARCDAPFLRSNRVVRKKRHVDVFRARVLAALPHARRILEADLPKLAFQQRERASAQWSAVNVHGAQPITPAIVKMFVGLTRMSLGHVIARNRLGEGHENDSSQTTTPKKVFGWQAQQDSRENHKENNNTRNRLQKPVHLERHFFKLLPEMLSRVL